MHDQSGLIIALGAFAALIYFLPGPMVDRDHNGKDDSTQEFVLADGYIYMQKSFLPLPMEEARLVDDGWMKQWSTGVVSEDVDQNWVRFSAPSGEYFTIQTADSSQMYMLYYIEK